MQRPLHAYGSERRRRIRPVGMVPSRFDSCLPQCLTRWTRLSYLKEGGGRMPAPVIGDADG